MPGEVTVLMPAVYPNMTKARLAKWWIKVGDIVYPETIIAEIDTEKAILELESVYFGRVIDLLVTEGAVDVFVDQPIAVFERLTDTMGAFPDHDSLSGLPMGSPALADVANTAPVPAEETRISATPAARRFASEAGVNLNQLTGTGLNGRIIKADVQRAAAQEQSVRSQRKEKTMIEITVPTLGDSVDEATLTVWFKSPGSNVSQDDILCELETDKVTVEVPAPASGQLAQIVVDSGVSVAPGDILAYIIPANSSRNAPETQNTESSLSSSTLTDEELLAKYLGDD